MIDLPYILKKSYICFVKNKITASIAGVSGYIKLLLISNFRVFSSGATFPY